MKTFVKTKISSFLLSTQKTGGQLGLLPLLFSQIQSIKTMGKPFSQINQYANFALIIHLWRAEIKTWIY